MSARNLRALAEKKIAAIKQTTTAERKYKLSLEEAYHLIHELQVHQIELDIQSDELRKTLAELEASRERYFDLYDLAPVGYITIDDKGLICEANLTIASLWGRDKCELSGLPFTSFIFPESQDIYYQYRKNLFATFTAHTCELKMLRKPDVIFWANLQGSFATDSVNETPVLRIAISDITDRKKIEEEKDLLLKRLNALYQLSMYREMTMNNFFKNALIGIIEMTGSQDVCLGLFDEKTNMAKTLSWSKGSSIDGDCILQSLDFNIIKDGIWADTVFSKKTIIQNGFTQKFSENINRLSVPLLVNERLKLIVVVTSTQTLYTKEDVFQIEAYLRGVDHVINLKTSEDKEKEMQKQIFQSSKLASLGVLAAGIGHEINNPLSIIYGYLELMMQKQEYSELIEPIEIVLQAADRIKNIVNGLKTYGRSDSHDMEDVDLHKVVNDVLNLLKIVYKHEDIIIENGCKAGASLVRGNFGKVHQVIMNLFSNARDALAGKGGIIRIETENKDDNILLKFSDNGIGIKKEDQNRIFDTFFTTKEVGQGTGLGLGIVYSILKSMNGNIEVDSEYGMGTSFTITLPVIDMAELGMVKTEKTVVKKLQGRALVVEDEDFIRSIICHYLKDFGLEVDEASDGKTALEIIMKHEFDFIITDLKMSNMSGEGLIQEVRKLGRKDKIIVVTGGILIDYTKQQRDALRELSDGLLMKPFKKDDLYAALINGFGR